MNRLLVFTDLDGSLLDHNNYSWQAAQPALSALQEHDFPLVINSSKTAQEIAELKQQLNNQHPFVCENGAVANLPLNYFSANKPVYDDSHYFDSHLFSKSYQDILAVLEEFRSKYRFSFSGFNDMSVDSLMAETGLDEAQARAAKARQGSEPLLWQDSDEALQRFQSLLRVKGLSLTRGGRFYHVIGDTSKGKAVNWLLQQYKQYTPKVRWITVGLGDGINDLEMLKAVDYPVLIHNPHTQQPDVTGLKHIMRSTEEGPAGWNAAVLALIEKLA